MAFRLKDVDGAYGDMLRHVEQRIAESKKEGDIFKIQFYALLIEALHDSHFGSGMAMVFLEMNHSQSPQLPTNLLAVQCNNCDGTFVYCMCKKYENRHLHCIRCNGTMDVTVDRVLKHDPS